MRELEWCDQNPVAQGSMESENNKRDRWLTAEEEARLLRVAALPGHLRLYRVPLLQQLIKASPADRSQLAHALDIEVALLGLRRRHNRRST